MNRNGKRLGNQNHSQSMSPNYSGADTTAITEQKELELVTDAWALGTSAYPPAPAGSGNWALPQSLPERTLLISVSLCQQVPIPGLRKVYLIDQV